MESHRFNPCNQIATPKLIMDKFFNSFPIASNQLERRTNCQSLKEELVRMRIEYLWKETKYNITSKQLDILPKYGQK
ncbi:uncharacterized protein LOC114308350 isoform X2 [Camellia sinensis]|uniref:uncharacterized protein LOC114308350 isoform X2 n=1 Tax=Camellia sinensis TaxID=4442 RepID=UPI001035D104|nr:uncharacterized protein LOC114308350 isoform X2 [Camellia sinensis]